MCRNTPKNILFRNMKLKILMSQSKKGKKKMISTKQT